MHATIWLEEGLVVLAKKIRREVFVMRVWQGSEKEFGNVFWFMIGFVFIVVV